MISCYPDWDTFEYYGETDNHFWVYSGCPVYFGANDLFVVSGDWKYGLVDVYDNDGYVDILLKIDGNLKIQAVTDLRNEEIKSKSFWITVDAMPHIQQ